MTIKSLAIFAFLLIFSNCSIAQSHRYKQTKFVRNDSVFIDIMELWGVNNIKPSIRGSILEDGTLIEHPNMESAFEYALKVDVLEAQIKSTIFTDRCGFCRDKYISRFIVEMNNEGNIVKVTKRGSSVKSISVSQFRSILNEFIWIPAKKDLKPVNCKFEIKIKFADSICARESYANWINNTYSHVQNYNDRLQCTYNEVYSTWVLDSYNSIGGIISKEKLEIAIEVYSQNYYVEVIKQKQIILKTIKEDKNIDCSKYDKLIEKTKKYLATYLYDEVIRQLNLEN